MDIDAGGDGNAQLLLELKGPKQYQIGLEAIIKEVNDESVTAPFRSKSSGPYRLVPQLFILRLYHICVSFTSSGYVVLELSNIPAGILEVVPSTFVPGQEGPFILVVKSSHSVRISQIQ